MIDTLKLSILRRNPGVNVRLLEEGPYLVTFVSKAWLLWTYSSRWVEVNPEDHEERIGEMHYGPVGIFYEKNIRQKTPLPKNHGKLWVEEDIEMLYELIGEDERIVEIAKKMGRSPNSVVAKTGALLGYDFSYVNGSRGIDDQTIRSLIYKSQKPSNNEDVQN